MKKILLLLLSGLVQTTSLFAQDASCQTRALEARTKNAVEIYPFATTAGASKTITLDICNPEIDDFTAFQCDLLLPEGITIDTDRRGTYDLSFNAETNRTESKYHTLASAMQNDGSVRILVYSTTNELIFEKEGAMVNIPITVSSDVKDGIYNFEIYGIVMAGKSESRFTPANYKGSIIVGNGGSSKSVKLYGTYTADVLKEFSSALSTNTGIEVIDLTEAVAVDSEGTITTGNPNSKVYLPGDVIPTGINVVKSAVEGPNNIYNLSGKQLTTPQNGSINIINGKKVFVK